MSFFEPLPPPSSAPRDREHRWAPPIWDRPSEGTLPAILPVGEIVHRGDLVAIELECLRVYPTGFTVQLLILANPRLDPLGAQARLLHGGDPHLGRRYPRIGVRFADGRTAGREAWVFGSPEVPKHAEASQVWVFPLPPEGPLEVHVALPEFDVPESKVVVEGALVRTAAERARVIWD